MIFYSDPKNLSPMVPIIAPQTASQRSKVTHVSFEYATYDPLERVVTPFDQLETDSIDPTTIKPGEGVTTSAVLNGYRCGNVVRWTVPPNLPDSFPDISQLGSANFSPLHLCDSTGAQVRWNRKNSDGSFLMQALSVLRGESTISTSRDELLLNTSNVYGIDEFMLSLLCGEELVGVKVGTRNVVTTPKLDDKTSIVYWTQESQPNLVFHRSNAGGTGPDSFVGGLFNGKPGYTQSLKLPATILDRRPASQIEPRLVLSAVRVERFDVSGVNPTDAVVQYLDIRQGSWIDVDILTCKTYQYYFTPIYALDFALPTTNPSEMQMVRIWIEGVSMGAYRVRTVDVQAPKPVRNFALRKWNNTIRLEWNLPADFRRNYIGAAIFRRFSVDEPFRLLRYDSWDQTTIPLQVDVIPPKLSAKQSLVQVPTRTYIESEREAKREPIYAIVLYNSFGAPTGYSTQLQWCKKTMKQISVEGAPLNYPNIYVESLVLGDELQEGGLSDYIAFGGYEGFDLRIEPEYTKIATDGTSRDGTILWEIAQDGNNQFAFTLLSVDDGLNAVFKTQILPER